MDETSGWCVRVWASREGGTRTRRSIGRREHELTTDPRAFRARKRKERLPKCWVEQISHLLAQRRSTSTLRSNDTTPPVTHSCFLCICLCPGLGSSVYGHGRRNLSRLRQHAGEKNLPASGQYLEARVTQSYACVVCSCCITESASTGVKQDPKACLDCCAAHCINTMTCGSLAVFCGEITGKADMQQVVHPHLTHNPEAIWSDCRVYRRVDEGACVLTASGQSQATALLIAERHTHQRPRGHRLTSPV